MSCCVPWILCQKCGEEFPIHMIEECCGEQMCEKCRKECEEKKTNSVNK